MLIQRAFDNARIAGVQALERHSDRPGFGSLEANLTLATCMLSQ